MGGGLVRVLSSGATGEPDGPSFRHTPGAVRGFLVLLTLTLGRIPLRLPRQAQACPQVLRQGISLRQEFLICYLSAVICYLSTPPSHAEGGSRAVGIPRSRIMVAEVTGLISPWSVDRV